MKKRVLLIGGTGFLGKYLHSALEKTGKYSITSTGRQQLDVLNPRQVKRYVSKAQIVINLTGQVTYPIERCKQQNTQGIIQLCLACEAAGAKLVQVSSALVYGSVKIATENSLLNPESEYAKAKSIAEQLIQLLLPNQHLIIRLSNLYGPNQSKGVLWDILRHMNSNPRMKIRDNDGSLRRNFLHVEDAANYITKLIEKNASQTYNLATADTYTIKQLVTIIEKLSKKKLKITYADRKPSSNIGSISISKLRKIIPVQFSHTVQSFLVEQLLASKAK